MCLVWQRKKKLIDISLIQKKEKNDEKMHKNDEKTLKNEEKSDFLQKNMSNKLPLFSQETEEKEVLSIDDLPSDDLVDPYDRDIRRVRDYHIEDKDLNPLKVWGAVLVALREDNYMTVHTAGGDIREISLRDFLLTVVVREEYLYNILSSEENIEILNKEIKKVNDKLSIKVIFKNTPPDLSQINAEKLRSIFGDEIDIK